MTNHARCSRRHFLGGALAAGTSATLWDASFAAAADTPASEPPPQFSRQIKLGLIGCGGRGPWLAEFLPEDTAATRSTPWPITLMPRPSKPAIAWASIRNADSPAWRDYKRLLDSGVEAVVVVNVPRFHAEHARAAIDAGCHVYAAKPVAVDVPRATRG